MSYEECLFSFYGSMEEAESAVTRLRSEGIADEAVSLLTTDLGHESALREAINSHDETELDALLGAGAGGVVGMLASAGVITLAGVGSVVAAGPILGAAVAAGALLGALNGWGVHRDHVAEIEKKIKQGNVLVVVHGDALLAARAHRILLATAPVKMSRFSQHDDASIADG